MNSCQSIFKLIKTKRSLTVQTSDQMILLNVYKLIFKILDFGLQAPVTPSTLWAPVTLVTVQTVSIQSADLGRLGLMLGSMDQIELDIVLMSPVLQGEIVAHIVILSLAITLTQVNFLQLRWLDIVASEVVLALTTLSLRDTVVVLPLVRGVRRRSHTSSSFSRRSSSHASRERERKRHKSKKKKKKHSKSGSSKHDTREKKHKRRRSPTPSPSSSSSYVSSDSSSSPRRSSAKKKSRTIPRSPSPAVVNPHFTSRAESPASHRDFLSLCANNDDEFNNSPSEDNLDAVPDNDLQDVSETHSEVSTDDIKFQTIFEEVFKLLPADMFPQKSEESSGGNRPKSLIELEMQKTTKKSTSLPQSRRPLMKAVDCLKESLGASKVDDSFPMPPTISQDWVPSSVEIKKLLKLRYYQAHNEYIPTNSASVLDTDAVRMGMSLSGSYPVKVSSLKDLESQSRDIIRVLSHAETFSFAAFKSLQSENMDSKVLLEILKSMSGAITDGMSIATAQTLGLQQLRREAAIQSAPKGSITTEAKRKLRLSAFDSKLLFDGQVGAIYKENMAEKQETLITNAVTYQGKPIPSPSSSSSKRRKPNGPGKKKTKPQETPKKDFSFAAPRTPKKGSSFRGSNSRGRGGGPPRGGSSISRKH